MSWTHRICGECWIEQQGTEADANVKAFLAEYPTMKGQARAMQMTMRRPVQGTGDLSGVAVCCFCGQKTRLGIFTRHDPRDRQALRCEPHD